MSNFDIGKALIKAFALGQIHWQQADSESPKQWCKADETKQEFHELLVRALAAQAEQQAEPIGHLYCGGAGGDELQDWEFVADRRVCDKLNEQHFSLGNEACLPVYAAVNIAIEKHNA